MFNLSVNAQNFKTNSLIETRLTITNNTNQQLSITNTLADFSFQKVNTERGFFAQISVPDYASSMVIGNPKLPVLKKMIEIPIGATPEIKIVSSKVNEYNLNDYGISFPIVPSQPSVSKNEKEKKPKFQYNKSVYNTNDYQANDIVTIDIIGIMRGVRVGRLNIAPVQYNPITNTIRVYEDIQVEVNFKNANVSQTIEMKEKYNSFYFDAVYAQLLNYKPLQEKSNLTQYPVTYVIVSPPAFQATLQPFVQWKTKKGFKIVEAYTNNPQVGSTTTSIKSYLQGLYNAGTPSNPAPSFVLFVGDVAQIPAFAGTTGGHVTDLYYCEYTGDFLPECYYGRFSATTIAELTPQIDKTLEYEQYLMPDPSFLNNVVMIAGQDGTYGPLYGDGQINYGTSTYFNPAHSLTSHTYLYAISGSSSAAIISNVSNGCAFANYTAHGSPDGWFSPSFLVADVATLTNAHKYPLMVGNCCLTNKFDDPVCFGEALLRASNKGALGYIGGSNSTYWDEDFWWGVGNKTVVVNPTYSGANLGSYDRTFHDHGEVFGDWFVTQGQMVSAGNLAVTQAGGSADYYWEIYHLMGDPSLMVYYSVPPQITATYNPMIPIGSTSFTVNTEPYAYVGLSMNGTLYGAALTDSLGVANITTDTFLTSGYAQVVVTKQNRAPFMDSVVVTTPNGPYVIYNSKQTNDVTGNNNGLADFGENITFDVSLKNIGITTANGVNATLSTSDTNVTITTSTHSWGNIVNGNTSTQTNAYSLTVSGSAPDQHTVPFNLNITDSLSNSWSGTFNLKLYAPALSVGTVTVSDPLPGGNNNGRLDPGETADIIITSSNTGHADAVNTAGTLSTSSSHITLNSSNYNFGTMNQGTSVNAIFNVTVSPSSTTGIAVPFNYSVASGPYNALSNFELPIGAMVEDWETGTFTHNHWVNDNTHPWTITTTNPYEGADCSRSGVIVDNESSELSINVLVTTGDSVSFYKKTSCEDAPTSWYDYLNFSVDGTSLDKWDGETPWSKSHYYIPAGNHLFQWTYSKDFSLSYGQDAAWIDFVTLPGISTIIGINDEPMNDNNTLSCFPNPANDNLNIHYVVEQKSDVTINLYTILGQKTAEIISIKSQSPGIYSSSVNTSELSEGIYFCILNVAGKTISQKIIIKK